MSTLKMLFIEKSKDLTEVLHNLIMIINDRINGNQRLINVLKPVDSDLKPLFDQMIIRSQKIKSDLNAEVRVLHEEVEQGTTNIGKIYRAWMDARRSCFSNGSATGVFTGFNIQIAGNTERITT